MFNYTASYTTATATPTTSWTKLEIIMNTTGDSVEFKVNGNSLGSLTTNIPSVNGAPRFDVTTRKQGYSKSAYIDYYYQKMIGLNR